VLLTAPQSAALHGDLDTVSYLISRDADFRQTTTCGKSSAYLASLGDHLDVLQLIVEVAGNSSVQMSDEWESSPLVAAISNQHVETAKWLCRKGSKVQYNLLSLASRGESPAKAYELVKWLLTECDLSHEIYPVVNAIQYSNFAVFGLLVMENGAWDNADGKIDFGIAHSDLSNLPIRQIQELAQFWREHINKPQLEFETFLMGTVANMNSSPLCHLPRLVDPDTAAGMLMRIAEFTGLPVGISLAKLQSVIEAIESALAFFRWRIPRRLLGRT
jgi:hypothetical protein